MLVSRRCARRAVAVLIAVAALGVNGCGTGVTTATTEPTTAASGTGGTSTTDASHRTQVLPADQVVWQVDTGGGFVPYAFVANDVAEVSIYGDGRIFVPVPNDSAETSLESVPRAVQLALGAVPEADLRDFLDDVAASGVVDESLDFGDLMVTDLPSTTVRVDGSEGPAEVSVYALTLDSDDGLTGPQKQARRELNDLFEQSRLLAGDVEPWVPDRVEAIDLAVPDGPPSAQTTEWPGPPFIDLFGTVKPDAIIGDPRCAELAGDDAAEVFAAALDADQPFVDDRGTELQVVVKALLPGEDACDGP